MLDADEAEALVQALRPVRPDLAEAALAIRASTAALAGIRIPASPEAVAAIVGAAALAAGAGVDAMRAPVRAALAKLIELGVDAHSVVNALDAAP